MFTAEQIANRLARIASANGYETVIQNDTDDSSMLTATLGEDRMVFTICRYPDGSFDVEYGDCGTGISVSCEATDAEIRTVWSDGVDA